MAGRLASEREGDEPYPLRFLSSILVNQQLTSRLRCSVSRSGDTPVAMVACRLSPGWGSRPPDDGCPIRRGSDSMGFLGSACRRRKRSPMNLCRPTAAVMLAGALSTSPAHAGYCYILFDPSGRLVSQGTEAPVDVTRPYSVALRDAGFDGYQLVVTEEGACSLPATSTSLSAPTRYPAGVVAATAFWTPPPGGSLPTGGTFSVLPGSSDSSGSGGTAGVGSVCHVGPRGGTYTLTKSGAKNYRGC